LKIRPFPSLPHSHTHTSKSKTSTQAPKPSFVSGGASAQKKKKDKASPKERASIHRFSSGDAREASKIKPHADSTFKSTAATSNATNSTSLPLNQPSSLQPAATSNATNSTSLPLAQPPSQPLPRMLQPTYRCISRYDHARQIRTVPLPAHPDSPVSLPPNAFPNAQNPRFAQLFSSSSDLPAHSVPLAGDRIPSADLSVRNESPKFSSEHSQSSNTAGWAKLYAYANGNPASSAGAMHPWELSEADQSSTSPLDKWPVCDDAADVPVATSRDDKIITVGSPVASAT